MLEAKHDNLQHDADGHFENAIIETTATENSAEIVIETANTEAVLEQINETNAEESEDITVKERHDIPMLEYESLSMEDLASELEKLVTSEKVMAITAHVEEIKKVFLTKYHLLIDEKKEAFMAENQDSNETFEYHLPAKVIFDKYYTLYKNNKASHFKNLQTDLKSNLDKRLAIVEELKNLINPQENIKDILKHFNDLRERWHHAGPIPKDKYNHVWNNYHFHVENFYDYLHLDREARDLDFKHNLEQKQKIIARVETLLEETDVNNAFRELQNLHRIWKEDIGPVSKEHRDAIWTQFSDLTKKIHDKREILFEKSREIELQNLEVKKEIIAKIEVLATEKVESHLLWLKQIEKVEALRNEFFAAGKVPLEQSETMWTGFKTAVKNFNIFKNSFYKDIKKEQNENLNKKKALVDKAKELKDSTDFEKATPIMKKIQDDWKKIGHVPRKFSDAIWKEFKETCNHYFERLKAEQKTGLDEEIKAFEEKKAYLEKLRSFELSGVHKTDLDAIKLHIETWKSFGSVPQTRRHIEGKFNKILDALFEKLSLSKKDGEMMRYANRIDNLHESNDIKKLESEKIFLIRKIEEIQNEIFQLENNIQFFTNTKNAKKENSIVLEVRKNIAAHKENLILWKEKLKQLRNIKQE